MTWLGGALLLLLALAPVCFALRGRFSVRGRRDTAMALYRDQAVELDRDRAEGRISPADHATALLEVQRRLLAEADRPDAVPGERDRGPLFVGLILIPLAAIGLYLVGGRPDLPAQPLAARLAAAQRRMAEQSAMVEQFREALGKLDPRSEKARQGEVMLGSMEASRGNFAAAAAAWRIVLADGFDPLIAAQLADADTRLEGRVSPASAALFRQALAAAPPDAPWRGIVQQRLAEAPQE